MAVAAENLRRRNRSEEQILAEYLANPLTKAGDVAAEAVPLTPAQQAENAYRDAANYLNQGRLAEAQDTFRQALQHRPYPGEDVSSSSLTLGR